MNWTCFQLEINLDNNLYYIKLHRYRGKYDHPTNEIPTTQPFELVVHLFGSNRYFQVTKFSNTSGDEFTIGQSRKVSDGELQLVSFFNGVPRFTIDGYLRMHLFFNKK